LETVRAHQRFAAERVKATGAVVEVCPTSNRRIAGLRGDTLHPIHRFVEWGVPFVVASDDPGLFGVTLASEMEYASAMVGGHRLDVETLREYAWRHRSEVLVHRV
jgi:adenosine deaminase